MADKPYQPMQKGNTMFKILSDSMAIATRTEASPECGDVQRPHVQSSAEKRHKAAAEQFDSLAKTRRYFW
jgi:hypothetical protein